MQEEPKADLNDSDTEDEEENERLTQENSHSPKNCGLILDNSGVGNATNIGDGVDAGYHTMPMIIKEESGILRYLYGLL